MSQYIYMNNTTILTKLIKAAVVLCTVSCFFLMPQQVQASHLVGGDITYRCLGDNMYEVTLSVRRDCNLANPDAIFDDPASIGILT